MGIATLGRIIEVISKQPFEKFIGDRIFMPLGMKDSHFFLPVEKQGRLAAVYTDDNGTLVRSKDNPSGPLEVFDAGGRYVQHGI